MNIRALLTSKYDDTVRKYINSQAEEYYKFIDRTITIDLILKLLDKDILPVIYYSSATVGTLPGLVSHRSDTDNYRYIARSFTLPAPSVELLTRTEYNDRYMREPSPLVDDPAKFPSFDEAVSNIREAIKKYKYNTG